MAACIYTVIIPEHAFAQGAANVLTVQLDKTPAYVSIGDYYSQVKFEVGDFAVPLDDNGQKQIGSALLAAFGLGNKVRSLTISAVLSQKGQTLPPAPLITYEFDGKKRLTKYRKASSYLSPRWQLGAADPISVTLQYQYSESVAYNPDAIVKQVGALIPSNAIVTTLAKPFVSSIASLTSAIFENSGSRAVNVTVADDLLLPYSGAVGARGVTYTVKLPDGRQLGEIKGTLIVASSLLRPLTTVAMAQHSDLERGTDDVTVIALETGGPKKLLLQEIKGTPLYAAMAKDPTPQTVRDYCASASPTLTAYDLTRLDRTTLVFQSLLDAGFRTGVYNPRANSWLSDCFTTKADMEGLKVAVNLDFAPPPKPLSNPDDWPRSLKSAMGCWITNQFGTYCKTNAQDPQTALDKAMANEVYVGVTELAFIDPATLPMGRKLPKATLLTLLNGLAETFSCFARGLIITKAGQSYNLGVTINDNAIQSIQILRASPDEAQCLGT